MMQVVIADDHALILEGMQLLIKNHFPEAIIHKASDSQLLFEILNEQKEVDVLIQDIKFGNDDARDFIGKIRSDFPNLKIMVVSTLNDETTIRTLFKQGVSAYVSKGEDSKEIIKAIEVLAAGEKYLSPQIKEVMLSLRNTESGIFLSPKEKQVLTHIVNGLTSKDIAAQMYISEKTVEIHRANLFLKFDVKNVASLVRKAIYEGMV